MAAVTRCSCVEDRFRRRCVAAIILCVRSRPKPHLQKSLVAGKELEELRRKLDAAIEKWTNLTEKAERLAIR